MGCRVLLVDDDPEICRFLAMLLELEGFEPVSATRAEDALALADQNAPAAVLVDVAMPDVDGLELCRRLRARGVAAPILVISARPGQELHQRALEAGADELVALVRDVVGAGGTLWVRARGESMAPALPSGALVRLRALDGAAPAPGDLVLAVLPTGAPALHRVVRVDGRVVRLRGDARLVDDPPVAADAVLARADLVALGSRTLSVSALPRPPLWRSVVDAGRRMHLRLTTRA
jgi:CheY-like chemotaxis protein